MKFRIETWTIKNLIDVYKNETLNLNPPYQRKFIWTLKDQQTLVGSILRGYAIPNIFLYERKPGVYEMVDGQQRTRTILGFVKKDFKSLEGKLYNEELYSRFLKYQIPITVIENLEEGESIEEFYALVNKAGIHLNRPELKKAEYFETRFYKLVTELLDSPSFQSLDIFTEASTKRMNDIDFVSELVTLLKDGISDKKIKVDRLFETDISEDEYKELKSRFLGVTGLLSKFNQTHPIKKTRYRQRNDLYTLFGILASKLELGDDFWSKFYQSLVKFNDHISPSNEECEPFQDYAFHCVSQSNAKQARDKREELILNIFFNSDIKANSEQKEIADFYKIEVNRLTSQIGDLLTINPDSIPETK